MSGPPVPPPPPPPPAPPPLSSLPSSVKNTSGKLPVAFDQAGRSDVLSAIRARPKLNHVQTNDRSAERIDGVPARPIFNSTNGVGNLVSTPPPTTSCNPTNFFDELSTRLNRRSDATGFRAPSSSVPVNSLHNDMNNKRHHLPPSNSFPAKPSPPPPPIPLPNTKPSTTSMAPFSTADNPVNPHVTSSLMYNITSTRPRPSRKKAPPPPPPVCSQLCNTLPNRSTTNRELPRPPAPPLASSKPAHLRRFSSDLPVRTANGPTLPGRQRLESRDTFHVNPMPASQPLNAPLPERPGKAVNSLVVDSRAVRGIHHHHNLHSTYRGMHSGHNSALRKFLFNDPSQFPPVRSNCYVQKTYPSQNVYSPFS